MMQMSTEFHRPRRRHRARGAQYAERARVKRRILAAFVLLVFAAAGGMIMVGAG
jgi:hypothetical protein